MILPHHTMSLFRLSFKITQGISQHFQFTFYAPFTLTYFMPNFVEFGSTVLEKLKSSADTEDDERKRTAIGHLSMVADLCYVARRKFNFSSFLVHAQRGENAKVQQKGDNIRLRHMKLRQIYGEKRSGNLAGFRNTSFVVSRGGAKVATRKHDKRSLLRMFALRPFAC